MDIPRRRRFPMRQRDHSRRVLVHWAGNAVQELPGLSGAFGPLNMWVGPFHEVDLKASAAMVAAIRGEQAP